MVSQTLIRAKATKINTLVETTTNSKKKVRMIFKDEGVMKWKEVIVTEETGTKTMTETSLISITEEEMTMKEITMKEITMQEGGIINTIKTLIEVMVIEEEEVSSIKETLFKEIETILKTTSEDKMLEKENLTGSTNTTKMTDMKDMKKDTIETIIMNEKKMTDIIEIIEEKEMIDTKSLTEEDIFKIRVFKKIDTKIENNKKKKDLEIQRIKVLNFLSLDLKVLEEAQLIVNPRRK